MIASEAAPSSALILTRGLKMKRLPLLMLAFAILSPIFILLLIIFRFKFSPYPLVNYQDVFDLLTPLVLIPVYGLLFKQVASEAPSLAEEVSSVALAVLWVEGHGIHLSANAIDNLIEGLARSQVVDIKPTDIYRLAYFFDEHLGHYVWHIGMLGLLALLIYREWRRPAGIATAWWVAITAGIVYGFTYFCVFLEGQTVILGLPCAILSAGFALILERKQLAGRPLLAFFGVSCLAALVLFAGWGLYWGGFPQFSDVGLI
jgi:hypothetical protein